MAFNQSLTAPSIGGRNTYIPSEISSSQSYKLPKSSRNQEVSYTCFDAPSWSTDISKWRCEACE